MSASEMAESYIRRAYTNLDEARRQRSFYCDKSVSASQECIEFSTKSIFLMLKGTHEPKHEITDKEFQEILPLVPLELSYINFPRIWLLNKFWASFYLIAKYGDENLKVGADKLFKEYEAQLALRHAEEAHSAAASLRNWLLAHKKS